MPSPRPWKMIRYFLSAVWNPSRLIPPATYGVTSGPHSGGITRPALLDAHDFEAELRALDGCHVAPWPALDASQETATP